MVVKDIATFFIIELVFLFAFAQCFVILSRNYGWDAIVEQVQYFFAVMIGDVSFDEYAEESYSEWLPFPTASCAAGILCNLLQRCWFEKLWRGNSPAQARPPYSTCTSFWSRFACSIC